MGRSHGGDHSVEAIVEVSKIVERNVRTKWTAVVFIVGSRGASLVASSFSVCVGEVDEEVTRDVSHAVVGPG